MRNLASCLLSLLVLAALTPVVHSEAETTPSANAAAKAEEQKPVDWEHWHAGNSVADITSLQRGARNFFNYCNGCHAIKYMRYQRMADDLKIPASVLEKDLLPPGAHALDYVATSLPPADALNWFGKVPPDLSLIARSRDADYLYQFLKTFYADPSTPTGSNNLAYPATAMPAVLSDLSGVNEAVFKPGKDGAKEFEHFETIVPGSLTPDQYDQFVRDTVNFLVYVGEPAQTERQFIGVWVVLFLVLLTWLTMLLKKEYWKDLH